jgi:hypothetical protein
MTTINDEFVKRETIEFNDVVEMKTIEKILKQMEKECIEDVSGELKLTVLLGEVISAKYVKTQELL